MTIFTPFPVPGIPATMDGARKDHHASERLYPHRTHDRDRDHADGDGEHGVDGDIDDDGQHETYWICGGAVPTLA